MGRLPHGQAGVGVWGGNGHTLMENKVNSLLSPQPELICHLKMKDGPGRYYPKELLKDFNLLSENDFFFFKVSASCCFVLSYCGRLEALQPPTPNASCK